MTAISKLQTTVLLMLAQTCPQLLATRSHDKAHITNIEHRYGCLLMTSQRESPTVGSNLPGRKRLGVELLHLALANDVYDCDCVTECELQEWTFSNVQGIFHEKCVCSSAN